MRNKIVYIGVSVMMVLFITLWYRNALITSIIDLCTEKCIDNKKPYCFEDCIEGLEAGMVKIPKEYLLNK